MALRPFAEMCDLSHAYIDKLEKGVDPRTGKPVIPTIDTLQKISQALNCPLEELLKQGGYIEKKDEVESELDLTLEEQQLLEKIKSDPELSILFHDYVCYSVSKRPVHMIKDPDCPGHYWKMERLDKKVVDEIKKIKLDKEKFIEKHKRRKPQTNSQVNLDIIENKIKSLDAQIDKLMDLYSLDHMPVEKISQKIEALYNEKKKLQENFETMKSEVAATKETVSIETILKYVDNFEVIWSEATFEEKREILQGFIKKIIVTEKVEIVWNI